MNIEGCDTEKSTKKTSASFLDENKVGSPFS